MKINHNNYINGLETKLQNQTSSQDIVGQSKQPKTIKDSIAIQSSSTNGNPIVNRTSDTEIIFLNNLGNYSKEDIEKYFFCSLSQVVSVATPQELKLLFSYIVEIYPYHSAVNTRRKTPSNVINNQVGFFYAEVKTRKDFAEYIKNDPLIKIFNSITLYVKDSSQEKPNGSTGIYLRYSMKVLTAILAAKNDDLILANNSLKNTLDNFRISINCCKKDDTNVNNIISLFILTAGLDLKPEFTEKYISQNIDILFNTLENVDASKNILILLMDKMAFNILERKTFVDQIHKYLRANASRIPLQQKIIIKSQINCYNANMLAINDDPLSYQEWNITSWYLLKDCFAKNYNRNNINDELYSEFIELSAAIIGNASKDTSYTEEIIKFFKGTVTGVVLEQLERYANSNVDRNLIDSIKEKNVDHSLHLILKTLKCKEITKSSKIASIFKRDKYDKELLAQNLVNHDPDRAKQELLKFNQKDIKTFGLLRCVVLLNTNKKTFSLIESSNLFSCAKSRLHFMAAQTFMADKNNMSLALKHIDKAISLIPEEYNYTLLKNIIKNQVENAKTVSEDIKENKNNQQFFATEKNTAKAEEKVDNSGVVIHINAILAEANNKNSKSQENEQEIDQDLEYFSSLTPKEFHRYWQLEHNNRVKAFNKEQSTKIWEIGHYNINSEGTIKIQNKFDVTYHIYVPTKIQETLGEEWSIFEKAIHKGFVRFKEGQSGIKYLNKDTVEIKVTTSDTRVTGNHYVVENDHIFIFDRKHGNHKGAKRELKINY